MTQLELFAGIGGFGLAGHWAGIETVCQVEIDPFCQKVLAKNFPNAHRHSDIKTFDGTQWRGVDIISGGFPCQPYSTAGKRLGTEDERHLWPEMLRVIREAQPRYVVGENVGGLISWSDGLVFEQVCADLEAEGYEVQPFVLPACAVNAPHRRDRVWFVAHSGLPKSSGRIRSTQRQQYDGGRFAWGEPSSLGSIRHAADTTETNSECTAPSRTGRDGFTRSAFRDASNAARKQNGRVIIAGFQSNALPKDNWIDANSHSAGWPQFNPAAFTDRPGYGSGVCGKESWNEWTSEPPICRVDDGISNGLDKNRNARIKSLGNAIVPQVAYQIFKPIIETENLQQ